MFICVGMQILFEGSDEFGFTKGLGIVKGLVKKIPDNYKNKKIKVPMIGWNDANSLNLDNNISIIEKNIEKPYYFTHSFYCDPLDKSIISSQQKLKILSIVLVFLLIKLMRCNFIQKKVV